MVRGGDSLWDRRGRRFGAVVRVPPSWPEVGEGDRVRPGYPEELFDDLVALLPGDRVVEVGAGTGGATARLVARGVRPCCVEPDPRMVEVLTERLGALPGGRPGGGVLVRESTFEEWSARDPGGWDALVSAQAWHWTNPATRWARAARVLRRGGLLALLWNVERWGERPEHAVVDRVLARYGEAPLAVAARVSPEARGWPAREIAALPEFDGPRVRGYRWSRWWQAREFAAYRSVTPAFRAMPERRREALVADIAAALLEENGGRLRLDWDTHLFLARRV
ncbi:class I SAM-dependent methyltransferase [Allostreptomyces psammosilenae]|uniref:SAM-dependent methyltransferase n=1 Tax=Allostreptomyces psammosilenae TaxID=1892865 RepID=A0A852ZWG6_9ACTN|nr:class I SAM-dependent methyltransferase [Allostreptomyces psammosilenae]NYI06743.1 SAM-dependent methyltransferase [Allostreptomyces psammosilenae]